MITRQDEYLCITLLNVLRPHALAGVSHIRHVIPLPSAPINSDCRARVRVHDDGYRRASRHFEGVDRRQGLKRGFCNGRDDDALENWVLRSMSDGSPIARKRGVLACL